MYRGTGPDGVARPNSSGITVIIIGLGYAGAVAAVECHRKGHKVIVFEQAPEIKALGEYLLRVLKTAWKQRSKEVFRTTHTLHSSGDVIGITGNAAQIISKWGEGEVHERIEPFLSDYARMNIYNTKGERLWSHTMLGYSAGSGYAANRGDLAVVFYSHVRELGIEVHLGKRVTEYFEDKAEAGVVVDGKRYSADCVLACDGVHSKARGFIIGQSDSPHSTGYAIYRAWFNGENAAQDPDLAWLVEGPHDKMETYIGPDVHCIIGTGRGCKDIVWTCTHKDTYDIAESWSFPGKIEDALKVVEGWDPKVAKVISKTPP
ncbi:hypothetical protein LTR40_008045, partial [Exophiala xenobiotica]